MHPNKDLQSFTNYIRCSYALRITTWNGTSEKVESGAQRTYDFGPAIPAALNNPNNFRNFTFRRDSLPEFPSTTLKYHAHNADRFSPLEMMFNVFASDYYTGGFPNDYVRSVFFAPFSTCPCSGVSKILTIVNFVLIHNQGCSIQWL